MSIATRRKMFASYSDDEIQEEIKLSPETQLPAVTLAAELAGAYTYIVGGQTKKRFRSDLEKGIYYRSFLLTEMNDVVDKHANVIFGKTEDEIEEQLKEKYPSPTGTRRVVRMHDYEEAISWSRQEQRSVWRILPLPEPLDLTAENAFAAAKHWIISLGTSILVNPFSVRDEKERYNRFLEPDTWRREGLAVAKAGSWFKLSLSSSARHTLYQRDYNTYKELMRGYFAYETMDELRKQLGPEHWPWNQAGEEDEQVIGCRVLALKSSYISSYGPYTEDESRRRRGTARQRRTVATKESKLAECRQRCRGLAEDCVALLELARRLASGWKQHKHWYRKLYRYQGEGISSEIRAMLPHLHGVEKLAREQDDKFMLKFCRWIRTEARAAKLTISAAPKPPAKAIGRRKGEQVT